LLLEELKEAKMEIGTLKSELDEIKHLMKSKNGAAYQFTKLKEKYDKQLPHQRELEVKVRDLKREVEKLIVQLAQKNLELNENK
jgi:hypothetical protein